MSAARVQGAAGPSAGQQAAPPPTSGLYPLEQLLDELLLQEQELWTSYEMMAQSLGKRSASNPTTAAATAQSAANGSQLEDASESAVSLRNFVASGVSHEARLDLIKYGSLTSVIHKYFRKLEKRHACLYLTARKAKHETLRHVECNTATNAPDGPPELHSTMSALESETGRQIVLLRDEELLVYRCALMCAQFPQLSAPEPPDGHSPTPQIPSLPRSFAHLTTHPSPPSLRGANDQGLFSKTAPTTDTAFPVTVALEDGLSTIESEATGTDTPPSSSLKSTKSSTNPTTKSSETSGEAHPRHNRHHHHRKQLSPSPSSPETVKRKPPPAAMDDQSETRPQPSDPIPIKGVKLKQKASVKKRGEGTTVKLPAVDSDEEEELVELTSSKQPSSGSYGGGREHPFSPTVNREMLCGIVRCAFHQTEEQQQQSEQALRQEYGRRSKGEILAKELAGQLQVLENNAHPFYKPKLFVTRNGYDIWLQSEKQRVRNLIDKFWHFSLPRAQPWRHYNPTDYHKAYSILLQKIVGFESRTERKEPVHAGRTPSSPLSPTAQRLLNEFGLRYGVGELFRKIVYLDYLAKHFDYEIWYIKHCTEELRGIRTLLPRNRNKITAVRREMEQLRSTVHLLHGQTDNSLTRIDRLFLDSDPREGVAALIELLGEVLDAEQSLFGKRVGPVEYWLKRYLKSGFVLRYERRKEIAADETVDSRTAQPFVLTATLVNSLLLATRDEVFEYRDKYQNVFNRYFDIVPFSKLEFYRLLRADACSLCARMIHKPETRQSLSLDMLGLMYRLNERDVEWEKVVPPEEQLWRREFVDLSIVWLDVLAKQLTQWVLISLSEDEWKWMTLTFSLLSSASSASATATTAGGKKETLLKRHGAPKLSPPHHQQPSPPFPSPTPSRSAFTPSSLRATGGAFMPYRRPLLKRTSFTQSIASSEGSGAVTDLSSNPGSTTSYDSSLQIAGGIPSFFNGAKLKDKAAPSSPSLLTFGTKKGARLVTHRRLDDDEEDDDVGFSSAADHPAAEDIEVSVSVYSGYDPTDGDWPPQRTLSKIGGGSPPVEPALLKNSVSPKAASKAKKPQTPEGENVTDDDFHPSMSIDVTDPVTKFGNLLDMCSGEGSDAIVRSKPRRVSAGWSDRGVFGQSTNTDEFHIPPASVATVPELADWRKDHAHSSSLQGPPGGEKGDGGGASRSGSDSQHEYLESKDTLKDLRTHSPELQSDDEGGEGRGGGGGGGGGGDGSTPGLVEPAVYTEEAQLEHFLFPVSNSPIDMVTMLIRLAAFTGTLLDMLTPKLKQNSLGAEGAKATEGFAPEVLSARQQATQQWRQVESMRTEFLKKLHRTKISSLKLYADNVLCMDLCGWPGSEASRLLGDEMVHHLHRRKEAHEIWGCRHMVEERLGLHPSGIPCQFKKNNKTFESITRDMCIRINNIQTLLTIFPSLERQLHSAVKTHVQRPITALGYISSDVSDIPAGQLRDSTNKPNPHRLRPKHELYSDNAKATGTTSWPSSISPGLGPMETDTARRRRTRQREREGEGSQPEGELQSRESQGLLTYLKKVQHVQLRMLCYRMNKFFKPALSLLLELKLGECSIEKRLCPLVTFLSRHRHALQKYIYPDCFSRIMQFLWEYILQDLEEVSLKLRSQKRPITDKAQMLLQALSHLIMFMHNKGDGLSIDLLTSSSEFLLGLLDIMTRSTDQLLTMFNLLSAPQFARNNLDLSRAPIAMDARVLHALRSQLHTYKKCFSGKEFVDKLLEIGRQLETRPETPNGLATPTPPSTRRSSHSSSRGLSTSNVLRTPDSIGMIEYTVRYAMEMGQYLLNERMLISVANLSPSSSAVVTPTLSSDEDTGGGRAQSFHNGIERVVGNTPLSLAGSSVRFTTPPSLQSTHSRAETVLEGDAPAEFSYSVKALYKFVDSEDADISALYQSQILMASSQRSSVDTVGSGSQPDATEFEAARRSTLYLVLDLLQQRARRDRRVSQVLQGPRALTLAAQRKREANSSTCHFILKM